MSPDPKNKKPVSLTKLRDTLDKVFSLYVRQKNADIIGHIQCFTCNTILHWKKMHCGHFYSRRYLSLRWDEKNTAPQCVGCNIFNQGASPVFALRLVEKYGNDILQLLNIKKNNLCKMGRFEYETLIKEYQNKLTSLTK